MHPVPALLALSLAAALAAPAYAQQRAFPPHALRAEMGFGMPPEVRIDGRPARLAPGARIRGPANLLEISASLVDTRAVVHYTTDIGGEVDNVWILRPEERANRPWPRTPRESAAWLFDPVAQTWSKP